jgi:hypothetical protein
MTSLALNTVQFINSKLTHIFAFGTMKIFSVYTYTVSLLLLWLLHSADSFVVRSPPLTQITTRNKLPPPRRDSTLRRQKLEPVSKSSTQLLALIDVPDGFFTITFFGLGLLNSVSKNIARVRMEERAWEQRLLQERKSDGGNDDLDELTTRRQQAANEWSAYGEPRRQEQQRVQVMERPQERVVGKMTLEEIRSFEQEYKIDYDPYYDDPYEEEELPKGKFKVDGAYGDRIYPSGEIFYKDGSVFYRQGAKPRNVRFW